MMTKKLQNILLIIPHLEASELNLQQPSRLVPGSIFQLRWDVGRGMGSDSSRIVSKCTWCSQHLGLPKLRSCAIEYAG